MWEFIDKVIYINLDSRQDRRDLMKQLFQEGQIPEHKIVRFSAIEWNPGWIGCSKSHLGAVQLAKANRWRRVLILEDDVEWYNFRRGYQKLQQLIKLPNWDVCLLGGWYCDVEAPRIKASICAHAYIVNSHYYNTLIQNYQEGIEKRLKSESDMYNIDTYWIKLQMRDNWIGVINPMCTQTESFSDIQKKIEYKKTLIPDTDMKLFAKNIQDMFLNELYTVKIVRTLRGFVRMYVKK